MFKIPKKKDKVGAMIESAMLVLPPEPPMYKNTYSREEWECLLERYRYELEAYEAQSAYLERLTKAKQNCKLVQPETLLTVGAYMASMLLITNYERFNVVTTKFLSFIPKLKI